MKKLFGIFISALLACAAFIPSACRQTEGKVGIRYYADGSNIVRAFLSEEETIGLIPEPAASNLIKKGAEQGKTFYKLDLQELYDAENKAYPQAVLMVKRSVSGAYGSVITEIQNKLKNNVEWIKTNPGDAVETIKSKFGASALSAASLSEEAVDGCKIFWQSAVDAKTQVRDYINDIIAVDGSSARPVSDEFFYSERVSGAWDKSAVKVYVPDGAPALAFAKFIRDGEKFGTEVDFDYNVVQASVVSATYRSGDADMLILPLNVACKFYNTDANVEDPFVMAAVITHGNFYVISTEKITVSDLKDKVIAVPNRNAVPDWTFRAVLGKYNLEAFDVEG